MLLKRFVTGFILAFGSMALVIWSPALFLAEIGIISLVGLKEFFALTVGERKQQKSLLYTVFFSAFIYILGAYFLSDDKLFYLLIFLIMLMLIIHLARRNFEAVYFSHINLAVFGFIYIVCFFSFMYLTRKIDGSFIIGRFEVDAGACFVIYLIFITAFCDIGAFFIGKYFGRTKLWPQISPNKTIEGALGGIICSVAIAYFLGDFLGIDVYLRIFLGFILAIAAQLGDLFESLLKREANVKDSGNLLAGHGGILDRFDSYFFTSPLMYIFIKIFILGLAS